MKIYAIYGASSGKIAKMLGLSAKEGERVYQSFWDTNWALAMLKDDLTKHWSKRNKKSIVNPVSGAIIPVDKEHTVLNYLFQNTGSFVMDVANHLLATKLGEVYYDELDRPFYIYKDKIAKRVIYYHDEILMEVEEEIAESIGKLGVKTIEQAGKFLNFNLPLTGDYKVGDSWADVH